eukprot:2879275-Prymnesium_polylepis.1
MDPMDVLPLQRSMPYVFATSGCSRRWQNSAYFAAVTAGRLSGVVPCDGMPQRTAETRRQRVQTSS